MHHKISSDIWIEHFKSLLNMDYSGNFPRNDSKNCSGLNNSTESAEETVREFLGVSREQTNDKHNLKNEKQEEITSKKDTDATTDYDSDHYSEIDANDHVGNIDTLVDDA